MKFDDVEENMPQRRLFYSRKYGMTLVSEGDTWDWARESYVSRAKKPADGDSDWELSRKRNFELEFDVMRGMERLPSLLVRLAD